MAWLEKSTPTSLDTTPIAGRMDLIGDVMSRRFKLDHMKGKKYPVIHFPSGLNRELSTTQDETKDAMIHVFGGLHLPHNIDRDSAYDLAIKASEEYDGYKAYKLGTDTLVVGDAHAKRSYILLYDNQSKRLIDADVNWDRAQKMDLLPGELRAIFPKLYANETLGMKAIAPIKFFTPDANWTWYPTEFDGNDLFFGLVSGFDVELGYFSLSELEQVIGGLSLPIERDVYFTPTPLAELEYLHRRGQ
jgi:hypothetical protein